MTLLRRIRCLLGRHRFREHYDGYGWVVCEDCGKLRHFEARR